MRERPPGEVGKGLTKEFKNRFWMFCQEMVQPYDHYSQAGYRISDFWMNLRDKLRYRYGVTDLADRDRHNHVTAIEKFLSECTDEHYLDFMEFFFQSEEIPQYFSDTELGYAVDNVNEFFEQDDLPYALTGFVISKSRSAWPRIKKVLLGFRRKPASAEFLNRNPHPLPIRIVTVEEYPRIVSVDNRVLRKTVMEPVLTLLAGTSFKEPNKEFLDALTDYRNGDYGDCVTKCGSAFESVMKIICERNSWGSQKVSSKLLNTILNECRLPPFLKQPLTQIAVIRNELGSAHGAGSQPKEVPEHLAEYTINVTASAILMLYKEAWPPNHVR